MTQTTASDLFPVPSSSPSTLSPKVWPGINPKSTDTLRSILKDNHEKWHLYFDPKGFHNHASHSVVALWALGANSETIKETYENDCKHQRPTWTSPEAITAKNFNEHLGDDNYYQAYIDFYTDLVRNKDISTILEEQIFDVKANFIGADKEPEMLNRFLDAIVHPMIHLGYGIEFGLPGMLVEGLASTAVHQASASLLIPRSLWGTGTGSTIDSLTSRLPSALGLGGKAPALPPKNTHALTILARILKDPLFTPHKEYDPLQARNMYTDTLDRCGDALRKYVEEWSFDHSNPKEGERKMEELVWAHAVIYGLGGWSKDKPFNNDFFIMHLVTSSLFLTSILPRLKPASQEMLLRGYFTICLTWWVARGRPGFDIPGFFAADTAHPGSSPASSGKATSSVVSGNAKTPNPWLAIIQTALVVPDDHFPKLHRSLAHFSTLYGTRAAGEPDFVDTELPFAELLDGTLFIRAAGLTNERIPLVTGYDVMGIMLWDHQGFYKEDYKTHKA